MQAPPRTHRGELCQFCRPGRRTARLAQGPRTRSHRPHGLGGQGKTALAVQYAYAYAGHYAAGGRWWLTCEGKVHLAEALEPLAGLMGFEIVPFPARRKSRRRAKSSASLSEHSGMSAPAAVEPPGRENVHLYRAWAQGMAGGGAPVMRTSGSPTPIFRTMPAP